MGRPSAVSLRLGGTEERNIKKRGAPVCFRRHPPPSLAFNLLAFVYSLVRSSMVSIRTFMSKQRLLLCEGCRRLWRVERRIVEQTTASRFEVGSVHPLVCFTRGHYLMKLCLLATSVANRKPPPKTFRPKKPPMDNIRILFSLCMWMERAKISLNI